MQLMGVAVHGTGKHDNTVQRIAQGSYAGNGAQNRAIAHGLGVIPWFFIITTNTIGDYGMIIAMEIAGANYTRAVHNTADVYFNATAATTTNFYVGSAGATFVGNQVGITYYWVAYG